jgi:hypothetical protein
LKVRPPAGQAWTAADSDGQDAGNRGLTAVADGPDGPGADPECQRLSESVTALLAGAIAALDAGDLAEARDLLGRLQCSSGRAAEPEFPGYLERSRLVRRHWLQNLQQLPCRRDQELPPVTCLLPLDDAIRCRRRLSGPLELRHLVGKQGLRRRRLLLGRASQRICGSSRRVVDSFAIAAACSVHVSRDRGRPSRRR